MKKRNCLVLVQHRIDSEYNDFIGKFYHFPKKYLNTLSTVGSEFVYYEPTTKKGRGIYFGYGRIGRVFKDKRLKDHYYAEILEHKGLSKEVSFYKEDGEPREKKPWYNPQNAARKIDAEDLDSICLDGGIILSFKADAHLVKVLGEELIASEEVGILELVKNSYDANATTCLVRIERIPELPPCDEEEYFFKELEAPVIVIEDDGHGMDRSTIEEGWMRPASTIKTSVKDRLKSEKVRAIKENRLGTFKSFVKELKMLHGGRLPLGEKGVGRFATHRLGKHLIMSTKTKDSAYEYCLRISWDDFDKPGEEGPLDLASVGVSLSRQTPSRDYGERESGTRLIIFGGREGYGFNNRTIKAINRSLLKLCSPSRSPEGFTVVFECPQATDLDETPIDKEFEAPWTLVTLVGDDGKADFELDFRPPRGVPLPPEKYRKEGMELRRFDETNPSYWNIDGSKNKLRSPECGSFFFHVDIWYRSRPWIDGPNVKAFTDHLDNYGGISIYRDGLNIFPAEWGAEVDWLKLSKRHIKKGVNLSYYNMIGNLELEQGTNLELIDKTDRQGLLNNAAFRDLATLVRNLVLEVENHFTGKRNAFRSLSSGIFREPRQLSEITMQGSMLIERVSSRYDILQDTSKLLEGFGDPSTRKERLLNLSASLKSLQKSLSAMQEVQNLLTEQAGYGLAIGVAVHEVAKITSNFYNGITKLLKQKEIGLEKLKELQDASSSLKSELKRFGPFRAIRNEPPIVFDIRRAVRFCKSAFERKLKKFNIDLEILGDESFAVLARYGAVNQILSNLLDNSCYWLSSDDIGERKIIIKLDRANRLLIIADGGPDIDETIRPYLFEPGYSLKIPPSGLGLYICKYYMRSMGGNIYEAGRKDRIEGLSGAQFVLDFSRVPEKEII